MIKKHLQLIQPEFVKEKFPEGEFILIDDLVENLEIENIKSVNPFINKNIINGNDLKRIIYGLRISQTNSSYGNTFFYVL